MSQSESQERETFAVTVYEHDHGHRGPGQPTGGTHEHTYEVRGLQVEGSFIVLTLTDGEKKVYPEHSFASLRTDGRPVP